MWSQRLRPACPLEFAMPFGQNPDFEFKIIRALSTVDAATTTARPYTSTSCFVFRSMYATPAACPLSSTRIFFASAFVRNSRFFVASAAGSKYRGDEKNAPMSHPSVQFPQ